ncbi:MAG: response regulator [Euryarchaeota archaeon]|nr:response regulator [Euryarchaeota archaeon]
MNKGVILLVEDDPDDADLTIRALNKSNIKNEIVLAQDGVEALDYVFGSGIYAERDTTVIPAVILLDLKLPKIDGIEVLRRIRKDDRTRNTTVVVLSSSKEEKDVLECYKLCANSYIQKPVNFNQFMDTVWQLGQYWLMLNEPAPAGRISY